MSDKVRIAFIMPDMELGGVEKSLIPLLEVLGDTRYQITLLLFNKSGILLNNVPQWIEVKELEAGKLDTLRKIIADFLAKIGAQQVFNIIKKLYHRVGSSLYFVHKKMDIHYDVAIAYKDGAATWYAAENVMAKVKIAFVHTDFKSAGYNAFQEGKIYKSFDRIYCASIAGKESFVHLLPELTNRAHVFYNIINRQQLYIQAEDGPTYPDDFDGIRILTIGRLSQEKGLPKAIQVLRALKSDGYHVRWYVIGKGREEQNLRKLAARAGVIKDFVFLGEQQNPYKMLKDCDIYVQPSNYEGYCIALAEARYLNRPVVACNFAGAKEQIQHGETGIITDMSPEALYEGIKVLLADQDLSEKIVFNLYKSRNCLLDMQIRELIDFIDCGTSMNNPVWRDIATPKEPQ